MYGFIYKRGCFWLQQQQQQRGAAGCNSRRQAAGGRQGGDSRRDLDSARWIFGRCTFNKATTMTTGILEVLWASCRVRQQQRQRHGQRDVACVAANGGACSMQQQQQQQQHVACGMQQPSPTTIGTHNQEAAV